MKTLYSVAWTNNSSNDFTHLAYDENGHVKGRYGDAPFVTSNLVIANRVFDNELHYAVANKMRRLSSFSWSKNLRDNDKALDNVYTLEVMKLTFDDDDDDLGYANLEGQIRTSARYYFEA